MRSLVAAALILFGAYTAITIDATPAPPKLVVKAQTEESIRQEMKREAREKQYVAAEKTALVVFRRHAECRPFARLVGERSVESGIPARVFAAMAIAESSCNPKAVSSTGDYGIWQINAKIWRISPAILRNPEDNSKIAARILRSYVRSYGLVEGLHHYNGMGRPAGEYSGAVLTIAYGRAG